MVTGIPENPFQLSGPGRGPVTRLAVRLAERVLGLRRLSRLHALAPPGLSTLEFIRKILAELDLRVEVRGDLGSVPKAGPLLVVANHPTGGAEGLGLLALLLERRDDVRVLANQLLSRIPELADRVVPVDPFQRRDAAWSNGLAWRRAARHLEIGGCLLAFPAGEVAHLRWRSGSVEEGSWSPAVGALLRHTKATVLPVRVVGRNSSCFQLAGLLHPLARTALLPRAFLSQRGRTLRLRLGVPDPRAGCEGATGDAAIAASLRARCLLGRLSDRLDEELAVAAPAIAVRRPLIEAEDPRALADELETLPNEQRLAAAGELEAWSFRAHQAPRLMREVGRLRELTFRAVGEGTGAELDVDRFDRSYHQLIAWSPRCRRIVGAYRIGVSSELLPTGGAEAFYTQSLFRFAPDFFRRLGPALELGRSFVRPEAQRSFHALQLLWKGIGRFVLDRPDHATLFGPVSTSAEYGALSRELLVAHLGRAGLRSQLADLVEPRHPFRHRLGRGLRQLARELGGFADLSALVSQFEPDGKGLPVLLRQYDRLGARVLGVSVDSRFSDVIDALLLVDLRQTPPRVLSRYLGPAQAARFLAGHDAA